MFYLNFDWNMQNDWMVYQNYELPVTAFVDTYIVETGSYRMAYAVEIPCDEAYWEERLNKGKNYNFADEHFMRIVQGANNAELSSWQRRIDISLDVEGLDVFEVEPEEIEDVIWSKNTVQNIQIVFAVILFVGFFMIIG